MHRSRMIGIATIAALAAFGTSASSLAAATPKLWFAHEGKRLAPGTEVAIELYTDGYCSVVSGGTIVTNGKSQDTWALSSGGGDCYNHPETVTGGLTKVVWHYNGTFTAKADMVITYGGSCSYKITHLAGTFPVGKPAIIEYKGTGNLVKSTSQKGCAEHSTENAESYVLFGDEYETSLEP